jgi:hypothetical protein
MDKVSDNIADLNSRKANIKFLTGTSEGNGQFIIDDASATGIDWRDRFIQVSGLVVFQGNLAAAQEWIPGGAQDSDISTTKAAPGNDDAKFKGEMFYSEAGMANYDSNDTRVQVTTTDGGMVAIYVDSTTGDLMMRCPAAAGDADCCGYNLVVIYSDDQGIV